MRHIPLDSLPWQSRQPGHRFKLAQGGGKQIRLLEFTPDFVEAEWCTRGHVGMILEGELELTFEDGALVYRSGDACIIPAGQVHRHKARALTPVVRMVIVEDLL